MSDNPIGGHKDPFKYGFCDGVMGRESNSPWKDGGYNTLHKNQLYIEGYMAGTKAMKTTNGSEDHEDRIG